MKNEESESSGTANQERVAGTVIDDLWTTFPNIHLRVLTAEKGSVEIQICDCGMSGQCRPQGWARIEKHNRQRLANAVAAAPLVGTGADEGENRVSALYQGIVERAGKARAELAELLQVPALWPEILSAVKKRVTPED